MMQAVSQAATAASGDQSAVIYDFDCIYSHDIQRKRQKRWHDGFLRFHAFNRRVMVYDIPRNFIGDTHLRDAETLQDGDELQLDRGVLVEVGESRGASRQDVTSLLEKKRPQPPRAETGQRCHPPQTHSSPPSSSMLLKPKPLNVVLGPRRGLQGRATLSKQSPHELAKPLGTTIQQHDYEPPAKRARLEESPKARPAPRRNTEQHYEIRKASSLLPSDRQIQPAVTHERRHSHQKLGRKDEPQQTSTRERNKNPEVRVIGSARTGDPSLSPGTVKETLPDSSKDRVTSKLKVSATKRPKLMYTGGTVSTQKTACHPDPPEEQPPPKRRAPLRVSALDQSSSPTSGNFTVMKFPMSQDFLTESTPVHPRKTLEDLDQELLDSPPALPKSPPARKTAHLPATLPQPAPKHATPSTQKPPVAQEALTAEDLIPKVPPATLAAPAPAPAPAPVAVAAAAIPAPSPSLALQDPKPPPKPSSALSKASTFQPLAKLLQPSGLSRSTVQSLHQGRAPLKKHTSDPLAAQPTSEVSSREVNAPAPAPPNTTTVSNTSAAIPAPAVAQQPSPPPPPPPPPEPDIGPWSRTAFDLFGFQVPIGAKDHEIRALKMKVTAIKGSVRGMMREYSD